MTPNTHDHCVLETGSPPIEGLHLLSPKELCLALKQYVSHPPCTRTIRRWTGRGLPHHPHCMNGRRYYILLEVVAWLWLEPVSEDYRVRAHSLAWEIQQRAS